MYEEFFSGLKERYDENRKQYGTVKVSELIRQISWGPKFPYDECLDACLKEQDWRGLTHMLYQYNKHSLLTELSGGNDHSGRFENCITAILVGDKETLERILPYEIDMAKNGYPFYLAGINLLYGIWYREENRLAVAVPKAEKFVNSKKTQWERAVIACLLAIYRRDAAAFDENILLCCKSFGKADFSEGRKKLCVYAHALYQLAKSWEGGMEVTMPEYKNFVRDYAAWRLENQPELSSYLQFPQELNLFNVIYEQPAAITRIHRPYQNTDNPCLVKYKNEWHMDLDRMREEFAEKWKD